MKKVILGLMSLAFILGISGCGSAKVMNVPEQTISQKATSDDVYKAIQRAGAGLGWMIQKSDNSTATATLNLRSHQAIVLIKYSSTSYAIDYKSSIDLNYSEKDGTIHKNYNGWIQNLNKAIGVQLSLL